MMTYSRRRMGSCCLLAVISLTGCHSTGYFKNFPTASVPPPATPLPAVPLPQDLPPKQAVRACLAVAAELEKTNYFNEAAEQYQKALKIEPRSVQAAHRLAVVQDRLGNVIPAQAGYRYALEIAPEDPNILNDMGYFCYERGNWEEAERWLTKSLAADPRNGRARVNLGMALAQQGKTQPALDAFSAVVTPAEAQANLGMILAQRGQVEEAKVAFRASLAEEPDSDVVQAALSTLEKSGVGGEDPALMKTRASR